LIPRGRPNKPAALKSSLPVQQTQSAFHPLAQATLSAFFSSGFALPSCDGEPATDLGVVRR
jgi:hypothetical protein